MDQIRIAQLNERDIQAIKALETKLGHVCLLAVERAEGVYVLEAKMSPNLWEPVDKVYTEIENLQAYFLDEESAKLSKASLKSFLISENTKNGKRPIRIRKVK